MNNFKLVALIVMASLCGQQVVCSSNSAEREAVKAALARLANKKFDNTYERGISIRTNRKNGQQGLSVSEDVDLTGLEIHSIPGAQFQNASITRGVLLGNSKLPSVNFTNADLDKANLNDSDLNHAIFEDARIQDVFFTNSDLSDSQWRGAHLSGGQFDFTNANLADMDGLQYPETRIDPGVSFKGALNMPLDQKCAAQQKGALGITYSFWENFKPCPNPRFMKKEKAVTPSAYGKIRQDAHDASWKDQELLTPAELLYKSSKKNADDKASVPAPESIQEARERSWQGSEAKKFADSLGKYRP